ELAGDLVQLAPLVPEVGRQPQHGAQTDEAGAAKPTRDDVRELLGRVRRVAHPEPAEQQEQRTDADGHPRGHAVPLLATEGHDVHACLTPIIRTSQPPESATAAPTTITR